MSADLRRDMAVRLANISRVMGLDDQDEELLWRYIAELKAGQKPDGIIIHVLDNLAETNPVLVTSCAWTASMPERFYKERQKKLARFGFHLRGNGVITMKDPLFVYDLDAYKLKQEADLKRICFLKWFNRVTSCLRDDGVNWEPPGDLDVDLQLEVVSSPLIDKLRQFM